MRQPAAIMCACGHMESEHPDSTRGYGQGANGKTKCYACLAEDDKKYMRDHGKITLYLTCEPVTAKRNESYQLYVDSKISNWPGSLTIPCRVKRNRNGHNWGLTRYDAWFKFEGREWHGVLYGDNTQLIHCKQLKGVTQ